MLKITQKTAVNNTFSQKYPKIGVFGYFAQREGKYIVKNYMQLNLFEGKTIIDRIVPIM